jgi:hypothetical protein
VKIWSFLLIFSIQSLCAFEPFSPFLDGSFFSLFFREDSLSKSRGLEGGYFKGWLGQGVNFGLGGKEFLSSTKVNQKDFYLSLFYNYEFFGFWVQYGNLESSLGFFFSVHDEKQIFFQRKWNKYYGFTRDSLGFRSGKNFFLNLEISRFYFQETEWEFAFGLGFKYSNYYAYSLIHFPETNKETFSGAISYFSPREPKSLIRENFVYEQIQKLPKKPLKRKKLFFKKIFSSTLVVVHPLSLNELLSKGIPLKEAILIQKASQNTADYFRLLKTLPKDTRAKCHLLQAEKIKLEEEE